MECYDLTGCLKKRERCPAYKAKRTSVERLECSIHLIEHHPELVLERGKDGKLSPVPKCFGCAVWVAYNRMKGITLDNVPRPYRGCCVPKDQDK